MRRNGGLAWARWPGVASFLGDLALCEMDCLGVSSFLGKPGLVWAGGSVYFHSFPVHLLPQEPGTEF